MPYEEYSYTPGQPAPTLNDTALTAVGRQGWQQGAAFFSRLEGQVYSKGEIFFTSTQGGGAPEPGNGPDSGGGFGNGWGQVWAYDPKREKLRVVYQSPDRARSTSPTTSPRPTAARWWSARTTAMDNFIRGLSPRATCGTSRSTGYQLDRGRPPATSSPDRRSATPVRRCS